MEQVIVGKRSNLLLQFPLVVSCASRYQQASVGDQLQMGTDGLGES